MILYMQRRQLYYIILVGPQSSCFYINHVVILPLRLFLRGGSDIAYLLELCRAAQRDIIVALLSRSCPA